MNNFQDLNQLLITIVNVMIIPILPVLTAFIIAYLRKKTSELENGIKNTELVKSLDMAENAIISSVAAVSQIYADSLIKNKGYLSHDEQKAAISMVKEKVTKIIDDTAKKALGEVYKNVDAWIDNRIEYHISQSWK